ncbi:hypothetical protein O7606_11375 [Micromonospora sp. WMMD882]|uniref:hypothetical protein n=1 Tax=Micromonospora sp. WMMD882 TaxID=3015151 RepID=UPI00248B5F57|nr:hypothetical protein [Micromonospora sp. WMMD882]WBB81901.1 hypothetical protein O7606_11375 [Micromonospora sp. WMMD882]
MSNVQPDELRSRVVRIIVASAEGDLSEQDLARADGSLPAVSYSSLSYIRMIDAIENEIGVYLDPEEESRRLETVDGIVALIADNLQGAVSA